MGVKNLDLSVECFLCFLALAGLVLFQLKDIEQLRFSIQLLCLQGAEITTEEVTLGKRPTEKSLVLLETLH